ncbi:MAG: hypothetical protein AAGF91_03270 [Actinomycetota bacterium]
MVKKSIAVIAAMIGSLIVAIGLDSGTALAHKVLIDGVPTCVENGEWSITWTLRADRTDGTDSWAVLSPDGYSPDGPQDPSLPFTRTVTYPASTTQVIEGAEVEWTLNGVRVFYARNWGTVNQPPDPCTPGTAPPATTVPPPVTDPPPTDPPTTDPPSTDPPSTDPPTTDPPSTDPPSTTEPPDGTPPEPVPPVTDPPDGGSSTPPPGQTDPPDDSSTGGSLPETGSDATRQALTAALLLLVLGGAAFVIAQPLRRDESAD